MSAASRSRASRWQVGPSLTSLRRTEIRKTCGEEDPPNSERLDEKGSRPVGLNQHEGSARSSARRGVLETDSARAEADSIEAVVYEMPSGTRAKR